MSLNRREENPPPKRLVEYRDGVVVGIVARGAERHHVDAALIHVFLRNEVVARLGGMVLNVVFRQVGAFGPRLKCGAQLGFHGGGVEVAAYPEDDVIGMNVGFVPVEQILAGDGGDGGVLRLARVRIVGSIRQLGGFARGDSADFIIAPRDAVVGLLLRQVEFVGAKFGILQQVDEDFEDIVEIAFQAGQADGGRIGTAAGFHFGGAHFEKVVELIAGLRLGAAGAPDFAEDIDQSDFAGGFVARAAANARSSRQSAAVRDLPAEKSPCRWRVQCAWAAADGKRAEAGSGSAASSSPVRCSPWERHKRDGGAGESAKIAIRLASSLRTSLIRTQP